MSRADRTRVDPATVERALADAEVGRELLFESLADLEGYGAISVEDGQLTVPVTLVAPSAAARSHVEREIRGATADLAGVESVRVEWRPQVTATGPGIDLLPDVKNVVAVASGKGGVGKSTVAVNLATTLAAGGADVGLLDADVYGPNAPAMLGLSERTPDATPDDEMVPRTAHGVSVMSMGFIAGEDDPVIWRGPLVDEFIKQLFGDVRWGSLDYLVVDLPPGTGDAQLSLVQHLPVSGAVVVTTPQAVAVDDARRGLRGFARYDVPVLGLVENMSQFECPDCESVHEIFDAGGAARLGDEFDVPVLERLPLDPAVGQLTTSDEESDPPGISIPGFGRLQLPRTRDEREQRGQLAPVGVRADGGETRASFELLATRTAARLETLAANVDRADGERR
ncbi:Mrp/NBP35 family ATP-binding protein [Natribaculum luteum]|uniref:Iron-sulfur cluster carrier protein n=1 Tax=Natribaculum luteum TaxID=1586232 RepID=A0ABD5NYP6_9EURY|nr:Mrp/NBP35 family ATP-binding protein [Natribaculum luteum]